MYLDDQHILDDQLMSEWTMYENITEHMSDDETKRAWFEAYEDFDDDLQQIVKAFMPILSNVVNLTRVEFDQLCDLLTDYDEYERSIYALACIAYSIGLTHQDTDVFWHYAESTAN